MQSLLSGSWMSCQIKQKHCRRQHIHSNIQKDNILQIKVKHPNTERIILPYNEYVFSNSSADFFFKAQFHSFHLFMWVLLLSQLIKQIRVCGILPGSILFLPAEVVTGYKFSRGCQELAGKSHWGLKLKWKCHWFAAVNKQRCFFPNAAIPDVLPHYLNFMEIRYL